MGGYSVVALVIIAIGLNDEWTMTLSVAMMFLANFMNHPHFISSYKIFFELYPRIRQGQFKKSYQFRWWLAASVVPIILIILLSAGVWNSLAGKNTILSIAILLYGITVGWHYVKQGFGMAMSEAALKKNYWLPAARNWMLWNAYACWLVTTCVVFSAENGLGFFGFHYSLDGEFLKILIVPLLIAFGVTTTGSVVNIKRNIDHWRRVGKAWEDIPVAGLVGYFVSLYVWVMVGTAFPVLMLIIPFFHSLQYMHIVNLLYAKEETGADKSKKYYRWLNLAGAGFCAFWLIPGIFDYHRTGTINMLSQMGMLYTAAAWLFINIHHYFIDNVIWRRENQYVWEKLRNH